MTRIARLVPDQQVVLSDFEHLAKDPRDLADILARTAVTAGRGYFGATVVKTAATRVSVATPLGLFDDGAIYTRDGDETIELDLITALPTTGNQRIVALVIQGQEVSDETEERDFRVGVVNNVIETEARPTATRLYRRASISTIQGAPAPQPARPVIDAALVVIAWVTLSSTEIASIELNVEQRINPLINVDGRVKSLETWRGETEPAVQGLKSDVAKLLGQGSKVDRKFQGYLLEQLARLNERVGVDQGASFSYTDYFLTLEDSSSDETNVQFLAKVEEGIRFADDNKDTRALALLTPGDTSIQVSAGGLLLPKYKEAVLLSVKGRDAEVAMSNGGSQTIQYVLKTISKTRIRYGNSMLVCTNAQWWQTGRYDSVAGVFYAADGTAYNVEFAEQHPSGNPAHSIKRLRQIFYDTYEEPYWAATVVPASYTGQIAGNTFMVPRSGWVTGFNIGFSRVDAGGGDVRLALCEVNDAGAPKYDSCLAVTTVTAANLKIWPTMTKFSIEPTYLEGGKRYAWFAITPGNHWLAMVEGNKYAQGTFFVSTDGAWSQGNISQDACFEVLVADFDASRLVVNLTNFSLSGGITDIDLLLKMVTKAGAFDIIFEVQVGSKWVPLEEVASGNSPLYGLPPALNARMVMVGTTDVMPGIKLGESFVTLLRPRTNAVHISDEMQAPSNVDEITVEAVLEHYIEANHDATVKILVGAGFGTVVNPSSTTDDILPDGSVRRKWTFTGFTPTNKWKRRVEMATVSALSIYLVSEVTDVGFPV